MADADSYENDFDMVKFAHELFGYAAPRGVEAPCNRQDVEGALVLGSAVAAPPATRESS